MNPELAQIGLLMITTAICAMAYLGFDSLVTLAVRRLKR